MPTPQGHWKVKAQSKGQSKEDEVHSNVTDVVCVSRAPVCDAFKTSVATEVVTGLHGDLAAEWQRERGLEMNHHDILAHFPAKEQAQSLSQTYAGVV